MRLSLLSYVALILVKLLMQPSISNSPTLSSLAQPLLDEFFQHNHCANELEPRRTMLESAQNRPRTELCSTCQSNNATIFFCPCQSDPHPHDVRPTRSALEHEKTSQLAYTHQLNDSKLAHPIVNAITFDHAFFAQLPHALALVFDSRGLYLYP